MLDEQDKHNPMIYEIKIKGHLDSRWADWFAGLTFTHESDGTTLLHGPMKDPTALHSVLKHIMDLGLVLISAQPVERRE